MPSLISVALAADVNETWLMSAQEDYADQVAGADQLKAAREKKRARDARLLLIAERTGPPSITSLIDRLEEGLKALGRRRAILANRYRFWRR